MTRSTFCSGIPKKFISVLTFALLIGHARGIRRIDHSDGYGEYH